MKNTIIEAIRNKYKNLGLGEKAIEAAAAYLEASVKDESEIELAIAGIGPLFKAFQSDTDVIRTAKTVAEKRAVELETQVKTLGGAPETKGELEKSEEDDDIYAKLQKMFDAKVKPIQDELAAQKAKETASARANLVNSKAKELGIPDWRINQGFTIADDADETAIGEKLAAIKQDIVTAGLANVNYFPLKSDATASKEDADRIVGKMNV
jgi:hypothetical protein